jgi:UDP-N-acetylglucosamine 2-epimerase (non-hydrolysing)
MIDSLVGFLPAAQAIQNGVPERYVLVTLHRPSNVDEGEKLRGILESLLEIQQRVEVVFPVHPRTRQRIAAFGIDASRLHLMGPLPYIEFLAMQRRAAVVITDSGGIQEETTFLGVPCLTMRSNTERPITVSLGTNLLVGNDLGRLKTEVFKVLDGNGKVGGIPPLWDGRAGDRVADVLQRL